MSGCRLAPFGMNLTILNSYNISKLVLLLHLLQPGSTLPDTAILKLQIYANLEVVF
jgi:hypothetical protein